MRVWCWIHNDYYQIFQMVWHLGSDRSPQNLGGVIWASQIRMEKTRRRRHRQE